MNRSFKIIILTIGILVSHSGCKKFLTEQSQDEVKPVTIQDLTSIMAGEAYPYQTAISPLLNIVTDDVMCNGDQNQANYLLVVKAGKAPFSWSKNMFEELILPTGMSRTTYLNSWSTLYKLIAGCNVVLNYADRMLGSDIDKSNLKAQALALRAYYYYHLVNMFGKPYNTEGLDPKNSLGVPLKLTMEVTDEFYSRNSVAEVYQQIEKDLLEAVNLFIVAPKDNGPYKINETAAYTLLSRIYLYEEKWDLALEYANKGLAKKSVLTQLSTFTDAYINYNNAATGEKRIYDPAISNEVIWAYNPIPISGSGEGDFFKSTMSPGYNATNNPPYAVSNDLLNLYDSKGSDQDQIYVGDLRSRLYFSVASIFLSYSPGPPQVITYARKYYAGGMGSKNANNMGGAGFRVSELYMNRAEANIQKFIANGDVAFRNAALADINTIRAARYDNRNIYIPITITDKNELLSFYKDERRREFPFDGQRWFDLRRYGMPSITHLYNENGSTETFTLAKGDNRYTWPIPQVVLDRNSSLTQNP